MDIFRSFSPLHCKLIHHPVARVSVIAKDMCEWMVGLFTYLPALNLAEMKKFLKWLSHHIANINGHSPPDGAVRCRHTSSGCLSTPLSN